MRQPRPHFEREPCKRIIRRQMNRSGNILLSGTEPLSDEQFFEEGSHGSSVGWTVGHLACVVDLFDSWIRGMTPALPMAFHKVFNSLDIGVSEQSKADKVASDSFTRAEIIQAFRQAQVGALETLDHFDVERWNEVTPDYVPDSLTTFGEIWEALGVHTYWHLGEICAAMSQYHGTYTLNSILHYFYVPPSATTRPGTSRIPVNTDSPLAKEVEVPSVAEVLS